MRTRSIAAHRSIVLSIAVAFATAGGAAVTWWLTRTPPGDPAPIVSSDAVAQSVRSGDVEIVLLSPSGTLASGRTAFTIEFRSPSGERLDVADVRATATMPMPGMVMPGNLQLEPTTVPGRYAATAEFGMAGAWQFTIEWSGPAGRGSVSFQGAVR